jgi:hypothetical protein
MKPSSMFNRHQLFCLGVLLKHNQHRYQLLRRTLLGTYQAKLPLFTSRSCKSL